MAVVFSLAAPALIFTSACARRPEPSSANMVAWTMQVPGESLEEGRLRAHPSGSEDRLVPGFAEATRAWVTACGQPSGQRIVGLGMTVSRDGVVGATEPDRGDPLSRCLADRARGHRLRGTVLAQNTRVDVALRFGRR